MLKAGGERRRPWERGTSVALAVNAAPTPGAPRRIVATVLGMGAAGLLAMAAPALSAVEFLAQTPPLRAGSRAEIAPRDAFALERRGRMQGRVLDARGDPVAGAKIELVTARSGRAAMTKTDALGKFAIDLTKAPESIKIRAEGDCGEHVESAEIDRASGQALVLVLPSVSAVAGQITDARGAPVPRATAKLSEGSPGSDEVVVAGDDGRYAFRCVSPGWRRLTVWGRLHRTMSASLRIEWNDVERDVRLSPAPAVRGTVVDAGGRAIALARVSACEGDDEEQAISDASGRFELPPLTVGCSARAHHPRFAASRPLAIPPSGEVTLRLEPGGAIAGVATDVRGRPITSFTVALTAFEPAEGEPDESRTGEHHDELRGAFRIDELVPGNYGIELRAEGMATWTTTVRVSAGKVSRGVHAVLAADENATEPNVESVEGTSMPEISVQNIDTVGGGEERGDEGDVNTPLRP